MIKYRYRSFNLKCVDDYCADWSHISYHSINKALSHIGLCRRASVCAGKDSILAFFLSETKIILAIVKQRVSAVGSGKKLATVNYRRLNVSDYVQADPMERANVQHDN